MKEHHRYLRGMRSWVGFRQTGIAVRRSERHSGESKYSALRRLKFAADGIFAFSTVPIRAASILGACTVAVSVLFALTTLYAKIFLHQPVHGFAALIVVVTFLSGVLLFFLGIIGEYVGRVFVEVKRRPSYLIAKTVDSRGVAGVAHSAREDAVSQVQVRGP